VAESGAKRHRMAAEVQRGCTMVTEKPQHEHREAQRGLERLQNTTEWQQNGIKEVQRGCRMVTEKPQSGHRKAPGGLERLQNSDRKTTERSRRIQSDYSVTTDRLKSGTITTYVQHPKATEVVAILSMKFRRNLMNTMDQ
jgi:hypothetical protein